MCARTRRAGWRPLSVAEGTGGRPAVVTDDAAAFRLAVAAGGRLAGLDLGERTIGVAVCDAGWSFATPRETLRRARGQKDVAAIARLAQADRLAGLVVGLPLNMDGRPGPRAQASRAFAALLSPLGLPVLLWDERWSTVAAERAMIGQDMSRARRAERIDAHAAAHILQGAIDALASNDF